MILASSPGDQKHNFTGFRPTRSAEFSNRLAVNAACGNIHGMCMPVAEVPESRISSLHALDKNAGCAGRQYIVRPSGLSRCHLARMRHPRPPVRPYTYKDAADLTRMSMDRRFPNERLSGLCEQDNARVRGPA